MKNLILILAVSIISCKDIKKSDSNFKTDNIENSNQKPIVESLLNSDTKYVNVDEKIISLKIPPNEVLKNKFYDEEQAVKIIYANISLDIQKKISPSKLLKLISFQGDYLDAKDKLNENYLDYPKENAEFLYNKMKSIGINLNLSPEQIHTILKAEYYYMKLINYEISK